MQVNTIDGGRNAFNAMLYNAPNNNTLSWINNNLNRAKEALSGIGDSLIDASVRLYNKVNSNAAINAAKALVTEQGGHTNQYMIYGLDYDNMNTANYVMQQYIIANPIVNDLYENNMCHGFEETYYNSEPGVYGTDRLDYRRVVDGVVMEEGDHLVINHYSSLDDIVLDDYDKHLILNTWQQAEQLVLCGIDPTDPDRGEL